jgi:hypothetical protein
MSDARICPRGARLINGRCVDRNMDTARRLLQTAISQRYGERPIYNYIEFMHGLRAEERNRILRDRDIMVLIDNVNRHLEVIKK